MSTTQPPELRAIAAASANPAEPNRLRKLQLEASDHGLLEVHAAGSGVMLIRRRVFERIPSPWFEANPHMGEDWNFCLKAQSAGCRIFCDLETRVGHIAPVIVWPTIEANGDRVWRYGPMPSIGTQEHTLAFVAGAYEATDERTRQALVDGMPKTGGK